jgi:hypothetical protein
MTERQLDIVGALEIVQRTRDELGVTLKRDTVKSWERRRRAWDRAGRPTRRAGQECMPDPVGRVNGQDAYRWDEVLAWMKATGKLKSARPAPAPHGDAGARGGQAGFS